VRGEQRLRHVERRELREEFRGRVAHRRVACDRELVLAIADLRRRSAAITGERQRVDLRAVRRVDADLVADGHGAIHAAGLLRVRERELLDARLEDREDARLEARGIDAVEHLHVREFVAEDLLDEVLVARAQLRFVVDARALFLVRVVGGLGRDDHGDLGRRRHHECFRQFALGSNDDLLAARDEPE